MPLTKLGLNISNIQNVTAPTFDIKNTTEEIINDIPTKANETTNGLLGFTVLIGLFFWLLWKFKQDLMSGGDFGLSTTRSIGLASTVCSIFGLYALNMGYFVNVYHVAIFLVVSFVMVGVVWKMQR